MTRTHTTIGIEIEYNGQAQAAITNIRDLGREEGQRSVRNLVDERTRYYTTFFDDRWVFGCDGTVDYEVKSHPLRDTAEIRTVMRGIKQAGGRVGSNCGTHIHVDISTFSSQQLARLGMAWLRYEKALDELQPSNRRASNSHWCASVYLQAGRRVVPTFGDSLAAEFAQLRARADDGQRVRGYIQNRRESKLNLNKFETVGTVEFRGHAGTLNFQKIDAWISCVTAVCKIAMGKGRIKSQVATFEEMLDELIPVAANTPNRPSEGSVTGRVWSWCDHQLALNGVALTRRASDRRQVLDSVSDLAGLVHVQTGINLNTCKTQVQKWATANGYAKRSTLNPDALRTYLVRRRAELTPSSN